MENQLKGYKGNAKEFLKKNEINIWDIIVLKTKTTQLEGILLPRYEHSAPNLIEIKLENNYNIGININDIKYRRGSPNARHLGSYMVLKDTRVWAFYDFEAIGG